MFYIGKLFSFKAFQVGDISYIAPLKGMIGVGVIILGAIILHEYPSLL
ncbi:MAG: hypothetical protein H6767_02730 [Candidatus Peribacteria bacterium]|nr:MAG: hypothetical protein H6767_02730 [Candidatus Peribacteria bacterium]